jgi:hypothetical protein
MSREICVQSLKVVLADFGFFVNYLVVGCCGRSVQRTPCLMTRGISKNKTGGIPRWSPTLVLVARFSAYVWQSGRDAQFSLTYGRMYHEFLVP